MTHDARDGDYQRFEQALEWTVGYPFLGGNSVDVLKNGVEIFPAMLGAVSKAETTIDFLTFVYWKGEIARRFARLLSTRRARRCAEKLVLERWRRRSVRQRIHETVVRRILAHEV